MIYHKIQTIFKRDPTTKHKSLLIGQYSLPEFEYLKDNLWLFTEKVDGTNIRVYWDGEVVRFEGRSDNAQIPAFLVNKLNETFTADLFLAGNFGPLTLYGEGYGARIQKGGGNYIPDAVDFILFDVRIGDWWLRREDVLDIALKLGIGAVPCRGVGTLDDMIDMCRYGFRSILTKDDVIAEGVVARPVVELQDRAGKRIITKLKCKDFEV